MNIYPLTELSSKVQEIKKDVDWLTDHVVQTWDSVVWLVHFAKKVEPKLDQLEVYADLIPGFQAVVADLKVENERLRNRQVNTATIHGIVSEINERANPPVVKIVDGKSIYDLYIPEPLFETAGLQVGQVIIAKANLATHKPPDRRRRIVVFFVTGIEIVQSSVDDILENRYNDT